VQPCNAATISGVSTMNGQRMPALPSKSPPQGGTGGCHSDWPDCNRSGGDPAAGCSAQLSGLGKRQGHLCYAIVVLQLKEGKARWQSSCWGLMPLEGACQRGIACTHTTGQFCVAAPISRLISQNMNRFSFRGFRA
jgi:hypothetical protein